MIEIRHSEKINKMIACKSYMKHEDVPENKEIFVYRFKSNKTDVIGKYILKGFESGELRVKWKQ